MTRSGWLRLAAHWAALAGTTCWLWAAGRGGLAAPPLWHPQTLAGWWVRRDPIVATFAAGRTALACGGTYLSVVGAIVGLGAGVRSSRRRRTAGWILRLPGGRMLAAAVVGTTGVVSMPGASFASGPAPPSPPELTYLGPALPPSGPVSRQPLVAGQVGAGAGVKARRAPEGRPVGGGAAPGGATAPSSGALPPTAGAPRLAGRAPRPPAGGPALDAPRPPGGPPRAPGQPSATAPALSPVPRASTPAPNPSQQATVPQAAVAGEWWVRPGDDLWSIAAATLAARRDRVSTVEEVAVYWQRVVATNRPRLPDPDNPSLIFPGDIIELPPS